MKQEKKPWSFADELRLGSQLFEDIRGHIDRDEQVPEELATALKQYQAQAATFMYHGDPKVRDAFGSLWTSIDTGLSDATFEASMRARPAEWGAPDMEGGAGFTAPDQARRASPREPVLGDLDPSFDATPFSLDADTLNRAGILTSPIEVRDGLALVTDAEGTQWDISEQMETLADPTIRERIRQSMMGVIPGPGAFAHTVGSAGLAQMAARGLGKVEGLFVDDPVFGSNIETALPGLTVPWNIPEIPDFAEKVKDPLWARALAETIEWMDVKPTGWEAFSHALTGVADFLLFSKGAGMAAKGIGATAAKALPKGTPLAMLGEAAAKGAAPGAYTWPFNTSLSKTATSFMAYEGVTQATNDATTIQEDLWSGLKQGVVFSAAGAAARLARGIVTPLVKSPLAKLMPRISSALPPGAKSSIDEIAARVQKFTAPSLSANLAKETMAPVTKNALQHAVDAYWMGVLVHSYSAAQAAAPGEGFKAFRAGLFDPASHATGAAFALGGALQIGDARTAAHEWLKSEAGQRLSRQVAEAIASPRAGANLRGAFETFQRMRAEDPAAFQGVQFLSPKKREAKMAAGAAAIAERPPDALPAFKEMRTDDAAAGIAPQLTVGEFNPDRLEMLGFRAKTPAGRFKHALNAVNEYLRVMERADGEPYSRFSDVPEALMRRVLDWRDKGKPTPGQMTLDQAAAMLKKVEAEPAYQGLAPLEQVAVAKAKGKRPTLGRALELVSQGKRDAAWLRESFPEGAKEIGDGPLESWAGKFERMVRGAWKQRRMAGLSRTASERSDDANTLQSFVRKKGGIRYVGDLESLTNKEGARGVVHGKKSSKGMALDDMAEAATEAGFFAERPTEAEMIDALAENIRHPESQGLRAQREGAEALERMHGEQLAEWRERIEAGELPIPATSAELMEVYAGDPRMVGLPPERVMREVEQLRAQAEAGDPGAMLAGPPETTADSAVRASAGNRRLVDDLKALDLLDIDVPANSPAAMEAVRRLAHGEREGLENLSLETFEKLRTEALAARDATRETMRRAIFEELPPGDAALEYGKLRDIWELLDAHGEGRDAPADVKKRLQERGWLDEYGLLHTHIHDMAQQQLAESVDRALAQHPEQGDAFASFASPLAFFGRKFTDPLNNRYGGMLTWQHWLDKPAVQEFLGSGWPNKVFRAVVNAMGNNLVFPVFNLGPVSRPQSTRTRTTMEQFLARSSIGRGKAEQLRMAARFAGALMYQAFGGHRPPQAHIDFMMRGMEKDGRFAHARGPEDFERMLPGTAYLWPVYTRARDVYEELGRDMVNLGLMTQGQLDALGGGKYLTHYFIREQLDSDAAELGQGRLPVKYQGRSMTRENGVYSPDQASMRVPDFAYTLQKSVFEETQSIRVFQLMRDVADRQGTWALTAAEVAQLGAFDRSDFQVAGVRIPRDPGESMSDAVARAAQAKLAQKEALVMGARAQQALDQMAPEGKEPGPGQVPWTAEREKLLKFFLGEGPDGPMFIPSAMAWELEIAMSEVFTMPERTAKAKAAAMLDVGALFMKRGFTIMRPANWTLQILGNVERNHALGGLARWDFLAGILGVEGSFTRDGFSALSLVTRHVKEGLPETRPPEWSEREWGELQKAQAFLRNAGLSTSIVATMGPEFTEALMAVGESPKQKKGAWMRELDARAAREGWTTNQADRMKLQVSEMVGQQFSGMEKLDTKLMEMMNQGEPYGKARSIAALSSLWNMVDLFVFKYPAYLNAKHEWPNVPDSKLLHYALSKTTHAGDTHPALRRYLSTHAPWNDRVWRAAQGTTLGVSNATTKLWLAQLLRHRFWIDQATMVPASIRATVTNPLRVATSLALTAGASAFAWSLLGDDERKKLEEETETATQSLAQWPALSDQDDEALRMLATKIGGQFGTEFAPRQQKAIAAFLRQFTLKDPAGVPMPKHGGESRIGSLLELTPAGQVFGAGKRAAQLLGGLVDVGQGPSERKGFLNAAERILGMQAQMALGVALGGVTGDNEIFEALGGKGTMGEALGKLATSVLGSAGPLYPNLGLFSPEGVFLGESVALGGQRWTERARGVLRAYNPQAAGRELAAVGLRYAWPSRSVYQKPPLKSPVDGWTALLSELWPGFDPSTEDGRTKMRAHSWVTQQVSTLIGDLYEQHFDEQGEPGKASATLDDRLWGAFAETFEHTKVSPMNPSLGAIEPGYEPQGFLLRSIAALPEDVRAAAIPHLMRWIASDRMQEDGRAMLFEAGRRTEMPKSLFREAIRNALTDPSGTGLVRWWWSEIKDGDPEKLGQLSPLVWDVEVPPENSAAYTDYKAILKAYTDAGMDLPPQAPAMQGYVDRLLREREGASRALQGGRAFKNVLRERSPLEDVLLNPR